MEMISLAQFFLYPVVIWQPSQNKVYIAWKVFWCEIEYVLLNYPPEEGYSITFKRFKIG